MSADRHTHPESLETMEGTTLMNHALRTVALPVALSAVLAVSACGRNTSTSGHDMGGMTHSRTSAAPVGPPAPRPHGDADVAFATSMIPHHAQAVMMADMALTKATDADVKSLAAAIKAAQNPESKTMSGWLVGWGKPLPTSGGHDMSSMDGSATGHVMGGMMPAQEMTDLGNATGAMFDRIWLQMMTKHHQGAVAMARTELSTGQNLEAKKLAQAIIDGQTKEITRMNRMLGTLPS